MARPAQRQKKKIPDRDVVRRWNAAGRDVVIKSVLHRQKLYVDIRLYFEGKDGQLYPSRKGLRLHVSHLPFLIRGLRTAQRRARRSNHL